MAVVGDHAMKVQAQGVDHATQRQLDAIHDDVQAVGVECGRRVRESMLAAGGKRPGYELCVGAALQGFVRGFRAGAKGKA